jgi:hypothetical protein
MVEGARIVRIVRATAGSLIALHLAWACGGESFVSSSGDASAGGGSSGGTSGATGGGSNGDASVGGGSATGGRTATGGTASTGGSMNTGGSSTGGVTGTGGAATGGSGGGTGGAATGGAPGGGAGGACAEDCEPTGLSCCDGKCVNADNDPKNCGGCGRTCTDATPYCNLGKCEVPQCIDPETNCQAGPTCCGAGCCGDGQICCLMMVGPWFTECVDPVGGTCPIGCPNCVCAAPDTPIATPTGERPIVELRVGDLVYSVHHGAVVPVPVRQVNRAPVANHRVVHVTLEGGRTLDVSAPHPTGDGRTFGDLEAGSELGGVRVVSVLVVPYAEPFTYDILPDSETGVYFAAGAAIGSTLTD